MRAKLKRLWHNRSFLSVLSGWFANLSAGAVGIIILAPSVISFTTASGTLALTYDIAFAILFLIVAVKLDERSKQ